jgi:hypothetical protein
MSRIRAGRTSIDIHHATAVSQIRHDFDSFQTISWEVTAEDGSTTTITVFTPTRLPVGIKADVVMAEQA